MLKPRIFNICGENSYGIYENKFLSISHMCYVGINQWIMVNFSVILDRLRCLQAAILKIVEVRILLRYLSL